MKTLSGSEQISREIARSYVELLEQPTAGCFLCEKQSSMQQYGWIEIERNKSDLIVRFDNAEMLVYSCSHIDFVEGAGEEMILFWLDDVYPDAS